MNNIYCPNCGQSNDKHNTLCKYCGMKIYQIPQNKDFHCPACSTLNSTNSNICSHCDFDFTKLCNLTPGKGKQNISQEMVSHEDKSIFMSKGIYIVIGLILVAIWLVSLFLPWYKVEPNINDNLLNFASRISKINSKNFWISLSIIWCYLPFIAIILSVISLLRKRIYSLITYISFGFPWIIGFVLLTFFNRWTNLTFTNILCGGEILYIVTLILFIGYDRLIHAFNITR